MNIFLVTPTQEDTLQLNEEESAHCIRVLRYRSGDEIHMVDGVGGYYKGTIATADARACTVNVTERITEFGKRKYRLHIAIAPTKNIDRLEWFLEKATEIGIDEITPVICRHSERREVKVERLNKVIVAAAKQSIKAYIPQLNPATTLMNLLSTSFSGSKFICYVEAGKDALLKDAYIRNGNALIVIGPEGDFDREEVNMAGKAGYKAVSLGESRLRTETAGVVACNTVQIINQ